MKKLLIGIIVFLLGTGPAGADLPDQEALGPALWAEGLLVVGLDVIGPCLTEVNVTSPTCFVEIAEQTGFDVAGMLADALVRAASRA